MGMLSKIVNRLKEQVELKDSRPEIPELNNSQAFGGYTNPSLLTDDQDRLMAAEGGETHVMPDGTVHPGKTHEEYEAMMAESEMIPDEQMEEDYVDFIMNEALDSDEKEFLTKELEGNDKLSIIFDKVVEVASEFSGEGPVDGPGTGVSDSIPARLSDGEFVFTAKAVEEIGADNLEAIMKEAEANADQRQGMATGGMPLDTGEEEIGRSYRPITGQVPIVPEEDIDVGAEIKKRMMDPATQSRYVRS